MEKKKDFTSSNKITELVLKKGKEKITMLTCYDYSFAKILDEAGIDIILVGDSLANVVLGMEHTKDVSFLEMYEHTKAVVKAAKNTLIIADMPYVTYQRNKKKAVYYAKKFVEEAGADGVKIEWFPQCEEVTANLVKNKIPVMGHIGLTPQRVDKIGGFRVQGKDFQSALELVRQAKTLEKLGVFSIVLECIPSQPAQFITRQVNVPTIGIGAGIFCDGQVLVLYDILGLYKKLRPKFVKVYCDLYSLIYKAIKEYIVDVKENKFPKSAHSFTIDKNELNKLEKFYKNSDF